MSEDCRTLYVGNLHSDVTEELLYELFLQAGPVQYVKIPVDKSTKRAKPFGFICFKDEVSVPYGFYLLDNIQLLGQYLRVQPRNRNKELPSVQDVGIHTLEDKAEEDNKKEEFSNFSNNLPPQFQFNPNMLQQNLVNPNMLAQSLVNHAGFPVASGGNTSLLGLPFAPPPLLNSLLNTAGIGTPVVDTNYINSFKNNHDSSNQFDSNRYRNRVQNNDSMNNYQSNNRNYQNKHDSYNRDRRSDNNSYGDSRRGYKDFDDNSRFSGRLEYPNSGKNYDHQQNDRTNRFDRSRDYRDYDNREYGDGQNRRGSRDNREYHKGGYNKRDDYNNSRRNYNDGSSSSSSSSRYHNSGSGNSGGRNYNNHSRY